MSINTLAASAAIFHLLLSLEALKSGLASKVRTFAFNANAAPLVARPTSVWAHLAHPRLKEHRQSKSAN